MHKDLYPSGTVRSLLATDEVTLVTHDVLMERLNKKDVTEPSFFSKEIFSLLKIICDCLIPQPPGRKKIDLAGSLDEMLATGKGKGWRYNNMPAGNNIYKDGISGIDETSVLMFSKTFTQLENNLQKKVLTAIQNKNALGKTWEIIPADLFFEELLSQLTEIYYSHPVALEEIGVVAMADAKGWVKIGLNELDKREPESLSEDNS